MDSHFHPLGDLFRQLGLPGDAAGIERFLRAAGPLPDATALADAPLWNASQAQFLREQWANDADWAEVVDGLDALMRG